MYAQRCDIFLSPICIHNVSTLRDLLPTAAAAQLVHSLVTSRLDYCNALLLGIPVQQFTFGSVNCIWVFNRSSIFV